MNNSLLNGHTTPPTSNMEVKLGNEGSPSDPIGQDSLRENEELDDFDDSDSDNEMRQSHNEKLDPAMMDELYLVCSNIGMLRVPEDGGKPIFMRGDDSVQWMQDLQRAVRRDHAKTKLVAKQLGQWKIVSLKLLPLLMHHIHDLELVLSILKVLVMLTRPPDRESTNIALQYRYLREYKHAIIKNNVIAIFMSLIAGPLSRDFSSRSTLDYILIELILNIVRNLLAIPNADERVVTASTLYLARLQEDLICTLYEENVYEMILLFVQDIDAKENDGWNLFCMEILNLTMSVTKPENIIALMKRKQRANQQHTTALTGNLTHRQQCQDNTLCSLLKLEKNGNTSSAQSKINNSSLPSRRHSNFGGLLKVIGPTGRTSILTDFSKPADLQIPQAQKKHKAKKRSSGARGSTMSLLQQVDVAETFHSKSTNRIIDEQTGTIIMEICDAVTKNSYFQLANSLKSDFRTGSPKLVPADRLRYFHFIWFLKRYDRLKRQSFETSSSPLLATLDMFSFNFVLRSIEHYMEMKNSFGLSSALRLLTEMIAYLSVLLASKDPRYQRIADSLQHKILYERDFLERLPNILKVWTPGGNYSKEYVVDAVTLTHLVLKILDSKGSIRVLSKRKETKKAKPNKKSESNSDSDSENEEESERQRLLALERMRKEADFDIRRYFKSLVSVDVIRMYISLLQSYRVNGPKLNHYILSFLYRVKHFEIYSPLERDFDDENLTKVTMQPLLFNLQNFVLFNQILQDPLIEINPEYQQLKSFVQSVIRDFFKLAKDNRVMFIEVFFRQQFAAKSCVLMQQHYDDSLNAGFKSTKANKSLARDLKEAEDIKLINAVRKQRIAIDREELEGEAEVNFAVDFSTSTLKEKNLEDNSSQQTKVTVTKQWTLEEDRHLRRTYKTYKHLPSVYEVLSFEELFEEHERTPEEIQHRISFLRLDKADSSDGYDFSMENEKNEKVSNDDEGSNVMESTSTRVWRRLRKENMSNEVDDDSDDDLFSSAVETSKSNHSGHSEDTSPTLEDRAPVKRSRDENSMLDDTEQSPQKKHRSDLTSSPTLNDKDNMATNGNSLDQLSIHSPL